MNIFEEGELERERTVRKLRIVRTEGNRSVSREIEHCNLDAILAVGFRVRSHRGTQFRQWAIARLSDAEKPFMGMRTTRPGGGVRKADAAVARNYLTEPDCRSFIAS